MEESRTSAIQLPSESRALAAFRELHSTRMASVWIPAMMVTSPPVAHSPHVKVSLPLSREPIQAEVILKNARAAVLHAPTARFANLALMTISSQTVLASWAALVKRGRSSLMEHA